MHDKLKWHYFAPCCEADVSIKDFDVKWCFMPPGRNDAIEASTQVGRSFPCAGIIC